MNNVFAEAYQWGIAGNHEVEDIVRMIKTHPLFDDYWATKYDEVSNIDVPLYLISGFGNPFHVYGTIDTFRRARSSRKWLRVHATFEWYEIYEKNSTDDLQRFFDRYCKGLMNGWEHDTSPVRLSLHGFGTIPNIVARPEAGFPLQRQELRSFYLDSESKTLGPSVGAIESSTSYDSRSLESVVVRLPILINASPVDTCD